MARARKSKFLGSSGLQPSGSAPPLGQSERLKPIGVRVGPGISAKFVNTTFVGLEAGVLIEAGASAHIDNALAVACDDVVVLKDGGELTMGPGDAD